MDDELSVLSSHSHAKQAVVKKRLEAIDRFLSVPGRTRENAAEIADQVGLSVRQFYALVAKVRQFGPVRALLPGYRNVTRSAPTTDGLAPPIEELLQSFLESNHDAKLTNIENFVRTACSTHGHTFPGTSAIRRRVHTLKRQQSLTHATSCVGAEIFIDQICLDLAVSALERERYAVLTLIMDRETRHILGYGLTMGDGIGLGLTQALGNFKQEARAALLDQRIAPNIEKITWVIPPGLEELADAILHGPFSESKRPIVKLVTGGPRRHGEAIMRLVGDRIGRFRFKRLTRLDQDPPAAPVPGIDLELAHRLIGSAIDSYNLNLTGASTGKVSEDETNRLSNLAQELETLFKPVLNAVEARFVRPRPGQADW